MLHDFSYAAPFEPLGTDLAFLEFGFLQDGKFLITCLNLMAVGCS